jgi:release factor glutamine methyltransferase
MPFTVSIAQALLEASETLRTAGVPEPRKEAATLLSEILEKDRTFLIAHAADLLDENVLQRFGDVVGRRATGEPSQYITGSQDFYGKRFIVTPDVLIPRPETEGLVETAIRYATDLIAPLSILDVGTGSGCIAITLVHELPDSRATGVDISPAAIAIARKNADLHRVFDRVSFLVSDCFSSLSPETSFNLIVSNPPYVSAGAMPGLQREVRDHEPAIALSPGIDGLAIIRRLLLEAPPYLGDDGLLVMEIGFDQGEAVQTLIDPEIWHLFGIMPDLQGIPRIVVLKKHSASRPDS